MLQRGGSGLSERGGAIFLEKTRRKKKRREKDMGVLPWTRREDKKKRR